MAMKVVIYTGFPEDLVAKDITPKLERFGVEVLKVVNIDRGTVSAVADADALCALVEKMSDSQRNKVKAVAKNANKKFIPLGRQSSEWVRYFGEPGPIVIARREPSGVIPVNIRLVPPLIDPPPGPPSRPAVPTGTLALELNTRPRSTESRLHVVEDELRAQRAAVVKTREERDQMTARCVELNAQVVSLKKEADIVLEAMEDMEQSAKAKEAELREQLAASVAATLVTSTELSRCYAELNAPKAESNTTDLLGLRAMQEFFRVRGAFKLAWETKLTTADDVLRQLLAWEPKD